MIDLKPDCKYAMVIPTSMGTRLTPVNGQPFHCSDTFVLTAPVNDDYLDEPRFRCDAADA